MDSNKSENDTENDAESDTENDTENNTETESDKSNNDYEINVKENRKKRGRGCCSGDGNVLRKKQRLASNNRKKRRRDSCSDEDNVLRKKRRLDSNELKKGGKYVPVCKSLKELQNGGWWSEDEQARFFKHVFAQPRIKNFYPANHPFSRRHLVAWCPTTNRLVDVL